MAKSTRSSGKFDESAFRAEFATKSRIYDDLAHEAEHALLRSLSNKTIKIHNIEKRVKSIDSIVKKCLEKDYRDPYVNVTDIAGVRIICLFRSQLPVIREIIDNEFEIISIDDKIETSTDSFGYMSIHFICTTRNDLEGPRYDHIKGLKFEIQLRTISMHAWAVISHYIDYKGDWDVPSHLRKSLNVLSALFYVADDQFEQFYLESKKWELSLRSDSIISDTHRDEINLDTIKAFLLQRYRDRTRADSKAISELIGEIKDAGYDRMSEIARDLDASEIAFEAYEKEYPPSRKSAYADIGAVRSALSTVSDEYLAARERRSEIFNEAYSKEYKKFRKLLS